MKNAGNLAGLGQTTTGGVTRKIFTSYITREPKKIEAAQRLRHTVFASIGEGLPESRVTGKDADDFDAVCDHLCVESESGEIVGTYRLQTGRMANKHFGFYSAQEFDFRPFEDIHDQLIELGRASVHPKYQKVPNVLRLLLRGIADYAKDHGVTKLIGCSSIPSDNPADGAAVYEFLKKGHLVERRFLTTPTQAYKCPLDVVSMPPPSTPRLLGLYLLLGAKICGPPALDGEFKSIDFLTLLDTNDIPKQTWERYFGDQ